MSKRRVVAFSFLVVLPSCDSVKKSGMDAGSVENKSKYTLNVKVSEGCGDGDTHTFSVAAGATVPFDYSYECIEDDFNEARIEVEYIDYPPAGYFYYSFNTSHYSNSVLEKGSVVKYVEDGVVLEHIFTLEDVSANRESGLQQVNTFFLLFNGVGIRPSSESVNQMHFGISKSEISPYIPWLVGSFEEDGFVFQPMTREFYGHNPDYYGSELTLVCDDISCHGKQENLK
jgi:hypothetical protein